MGPRTKTRCHVRTVGVLIAGALTLGIVPAASGSADTTTSVVTTSSTPPPATTTSSTIPRAAPLLRLGSQGPAVRNLQHRLSSLGYWLGGVDGRFGNLTRHAVSALQKAASGSAVEIDLRRNLLLIVRDGKLATTLNTSTGGGYSYTSGGVTSIARTPQGVFAVFRQVDGLDISPLGELWRPKYFAGGYAIHGSASVPPFPASHGCVRVSNQAMDWIWTTNRMPIGIRVWIYY